MTAEDWFRLSASPAEELADDYQRAQPFPHSVIDGLLDPERLATLEQYFPGAGWPHWQTFTDSYQPHKSYSEDIRAMPPAFADVIRSASEPPMLAWLSTLTGIPSLLPDPYLVGGGLHRTGPGGLLRPHTDFHHHRSGMHRRVNLLIYLNRDWPKGAGGELCLFSSEDAETPKQRIALELGRTVVFTTDDRSLHGFSEPVPEGRTRKSIALYYYTVDESSANFAGDSNTFWRTHRRTPGLRSTTRLLGDRALLKASRALSYAAHRVHPEFGTVTQRGA